MAYMNLYVIVSGERKRRQQVWYKFNSTTA